MTRVTFVLRRLERGGAEAQLVQLAGALVRRDMAVSVVTMYAGGDLLERCRRSGVTVVHIGKAGRWDVPAFFWRFMRTCADTRPEILVGWMPTENLLCLAYRLLGGRVRLVWSARAAFENLAAYDRLTRFVYGAQRLLGRMPDLLLANSRAGFRLFGTDAHDVRAIAVSNALDTNRFCPNASLGQEFRRKHGIDAGSSLVGIVGRLDPMKGHAVLFEALRELHDVSAAIRLLVVGATDVDYAATVQRAARNFGVFERIVWIDAVDEIEAAINALNVLVSASLFGEGTQNVLLEAMACGVPVVATDVGEAARMLSPLDFVVKPGASRELAQAIRAALAADSPEARQRRRVHVESRFGPDGSADIVADAFRRLVSARVGVAH
jgi:glycosyltransferase involved in cell wall biosynthesis